MAVFDAGAYLGAHFVRPTEDQLTKIANYDSAFGAIGLATLWRGTGFFVLPLLSIGGPNNNTYQGAGYVARVPFKVVGVDCAYESTAGASLTLDLLKKPSGGAYASMLEAPVNVFATAKVGVAGSVTNGKEDIEVGDSLQLQGVGGAGGAAIGCQALVYCYRR
jgi:hypothetical protein